MEFPTGITGTALLARTRDQARKFGVEMAITNEEIALDELCRTWAVATGCLDRSNRATPAAWPAFTRHTMN